MSMTVIPPSALIPQITARSSCVRPEPCTPHNCGLEGAIKNYKSKLTAKLILVETTLPPEGLIGAVENPHEVRGATPQLLVLGPVHGVVLLPEMVAR